MRLLVIVVAAGFSVVSAPNRTLAGSVLPASGSGDCRPSATPLRESIAGEAENGAMNAVESGKGTGPSRARQSRRTHLERAIEWTERGREIASADCYDRALENLEVARRLPAEADSRITSDNTDITSDTSDTSGSELDLVEAWTRLGRHEFEAAAKLAESVVEARPEDPAAWGVLGDALMEVGRYDEAASAYQEMLRLKPGPSSYSRAAHYRELIGDHVGALALLDAALVALPFGAAEPRAWTLVQIAKIHEKEASWPAAERAYAKALELRPDYHYGLAGMARVALAQADEPRSLAMARAAFEAAPHPENRLLVADALELAGRLEEARAEERRFEREALSNVDQADNENLFLVDYYLERDPKPEEALAVARLEASRRADVGTLSRLMRALDRTGNTDEARRVEARIRAATDLKGGTGASGEEFLGLDLDATRDHARLAAPETGTTHD